MIKPRPQFQGLNVTFHVTEECNLRCAYCYEANKRPTTLRLDHAQLFIDILLDDPDPIGARGTDMEWVLDNGLIMDFIGGDALMKPKLCDDILTYFMWASMRRGHRWATNYRVSISTNGTLFGDPAVRAMMEKWRNVLCIGVSLDGTPEIHNLNRSDSMPAIMKHWDWFREFSGPNAQSTKATLNAQSVPYIYDSVRFLHEGLGIRWIDMNFIFEKMTPAPDLAELDRQLEKVVEYLLQHDDIYLGLLRRSFADPGGADPERGWCGSGAMPCLDVNGKIYPCFRFTPQNMLGPWPDFNVGDVWNGMNRKDRFCHVREQKRGKISPDMCKVCPLDGACAWCIASSYAESGEFYRQTNVCEVFKLQAKWAREYWRIYDGRVPGGNDQGAEQDRGGVRGDRGQPDPVAGTVG